MSFVLNPRLRRWLIIGAIVVVALPSGYYLARHQALPAYRSWREAKLERMTKDFMATGDFDNALLTARQALRKNQRSLRHWRLAAAAAKAKDSPEVIYYQRNVAQLERSLDSQLELLRLSLKYGAYRDALDTLEKVAPGATNNPEFHRLASQTYLNVGRRVAAKVHLDSLISLQPGDHKARVDLLEIKLSEDAEGKDPTLRAELEVLAREPSLRSRVVGLLLKDAIGRQEKERAVDFALQLRRESPLSSEDQELVLAGLALGDAAQADGYRQQLQTQIKSDPPAVVALANYFRTTAMATEAQEWFESLEPEVRKNPTVQEAIAAAYLEWKDWTRLDRLIAGSHWGEREFMRHAYTAYSARKTERVAEAGSAWRLAVIQAGDNTRATSELLTLVSRWGWQTEQYDLVWKLFALMPRNESISQQLIAWEHQQGRTANLNRIYARLVQFGGEDLMLKNNFAYTSLLLDANLSRAFEMARNNYRADPANPYYTTTQAFALYKQNKPEDALKLLETLRPSALSDPERTMFRALFRAGAGDAVGAADLLEGLKATRFLPEERQLMARAAGEVARLDRERGQSLRLHALDTSGGIDRSKGWLKLVPNLGREEPTLEMQTADSLYAMGDLRELAAQLRKGAWGAHEHLRFALIAYVARSRKDDGSARSYWRTALGSAVGERAKLSELGQLATAWTWKAEQMEVAARVFEIDPSDRNGFAELMTHYRSSLRTAELVAVLTAYLSAHPQDQDQLCSLAYYSMLSGLNVARAYITAQSTYEAAPDDSRRQLVYAFALWKQGRSEEAWNLVKNVNDSPGDLVPSALLRAAILADLDRGSDAVVALERFDPTRALPEESRLAALIASRVKADARLSSAR